MVTGTSLQEGLQTMHMLASDGSLDTYILDLIFLSASTQARDHNDLATETQAKIHELKHGRVEFERAQELETIASAAIAARSITSRVAFSQLAAHTKALHPELYEHVFVKSASELSHRGNAARVQALRTQLAHLEGLAAADALRVQFAPLLRATADDLEHAIENKDTVLQQASVLRAQLVEMRTSVNAFRLTIHGRLETIYKSKSLADEFFRPAPRHADAHAPPAAAPAAT